MSNEQESRSERTFEERIAADLEWHHRELDPDENAETTPPADERIETCCIWVTECYPPSHAGSLISGLKKLCWNKRGPRDLYGDEVTAWLERERGHSYGGAWLNLGHLVRQREGERFIGANARVAELPEGVDYAFAYVRNVLPSLTVLKDLEERHASLTRHLRPNRRKRDGTSSSTRRGTWTRVNSRYTCLTSRTRWRTSTS